MFFKSMEELLPIIEREGIRVECQSHPYDFVELNDEACDIVKSFRSKKPGLRLLRIPRLLLRSGQGRRSPHAEVRRR